MKQNILIFAAILLLLMSSRSTAQTYQQEYNPWPVIHGNDTVAIPFWGGLSNPKPGLFDLTGDGIPELTIGGPVGRIGYFKNIGTSARPEWEPVSSRLGGIDIGTWHTFADVDGDGDLDLFADSRFGSVSFYRNITTGTNLEFVFVDTGFGGFKTGINNTPTFIDIDADGDIDFFFGGLSGNLEFYENVGDRFNPLYVFKNAFYDSILAFPGSGGGGSSVAPAPEHGFSNIRFADIDSDNDYDLYWGDINNPHLYFFVNNGDSVLSDLTYVTENLLPSAIIGFNHMAFADLDADGDQDMLLGVATENDNLQLYENVGTPFIPDFQVVDSNLLEIIDIGSSSRPALADLDNDGDLDLLLGGTTGRLSYYKNTGTRFSPVFELVSDFAFGIDVGSNSAPVLCDWDSDGDLDLFIGTLTGMIQYWRNDGTTADFVPVLASSQFGGIKVDQVAIPIPVDLNDDSLLDLVVGEWDFNGFANILLYENTGTAQNPQITLRTRTMIKRTASELSSPYFYDFDLDGRKDLILGHRNNGLVLYRNMTAVGFFPDSTTLVVQSDSLPGSDDGRWLAPVFVDIDSDGDDDLFTGELDGGLNFHRRLGSCCIGVTGNIDKDPLELIDIDDITLMIDYLFLSQRPLPCILEADVEIDFNNTIDIGDLTFLISHLYIAPRTFLPCP